MRRSSVLSVIVFLAILSVSSTYAQQTQPASPNPNEKILVDKSLLNADQLMKVEVQQKLQQYGETAKWGHEIGVAVNETLAALTDNTAKFAQTDVGKLAMFLVAWKIMAKDVLAMGDMTLGYIIGPPLFFFGCLAILWSYRRLCMPRYCLISEDKDGKKTYGFLDPSEESGFDRSQWAAMHAAAFVGLTLISCIITFANGV